MKADNAESQLIGRAGSSEVSSRISVSGNPRPVFPLIAKGASRLVVVLPRLRREQQMKHVGLRRGSRWVLV